MSDGATFDGKELGLPVISVGSSTVLGMVSMSNHERLSRGVACPITSEKASNHIPCRVIRMTTSLCPLALLAWLMIAISGCAALQEQIVEAEIEDAIRNYNARASEVSLGDHKEKVLSILGPSQEHLRGELRRPPEAFTTDHETVEIYYFRSSWTRDGKSTDDEFTPFVFRNGRLTSIGWQALGGPKSVGER
jgi:hypothetical protein